MECPLQDLLGTPAAERDSYKVIFHYEGKWARFKFHFLSYFSRLYRKTKTKRATKQTILNMMVAPKYEGDSRDLRIVLLGVSGAGKTSVGNTILGREAFNESTTRETEIQRGRVEDRNISIIDTPGLFSTHLTDDELQEQMMKSLHLSEPGPHVFLLVVNLETFEEDQRNITETIEEIFGDQALEFTMVLFTGREGMSTRKWKEFELSEKFQDLVSKCREQYHVINGKNEVTQTHIKTLLKKIGEFIKQNEHFNNKIYLVSQTKSTKEKKKQETIYRKKEQEKGSQEQAMQVTFGMNSKLKKKTTDMNEDTALQEMSSLQKFLDFSCERAEEQNQSQKIVKKQDNGSKKSQKKRQTGGKHPTQAGESGYLGFSIKHFIILLVIIILQGISMKAERDKIKSCETTVQGFNQTISRLQDTNSKLITEKDQWYQFAKKQVMPDLRIMLVGKYGAGKSASGNTILRRNVFKENISIESVTNVCQKHERDGITVIDTPGMFDTNISESQLKKELEKCVNMSFPGPHVFLLVIRLDVRFTDEEKNTVKWIQTSFGENADNYTLILFTRGDQLSKPIEQFLTENRQINELVRQCKSRYHVFNNKDTNSAQVNELLEKIVKMVMENGREHYTNMMYKEAQKRQREKEERPSLEEENNVGLLSVAIVMCVMALLIYLCKRKMGNAPSLSVNSKSEQNLKRVPVLNHL